MSIQVEHGAVFKLDNAGGTLTDYSAGVGGVTPPDAQHTVSGHYVINDANELTTEGGAAATFTAEVYRDPSASSLHSVLVAWSRASGGTGGLRTFQLDMPDSTTGSERYTGECRLVSYTPGRVAGGSSEASRGSATFRCDNGYTHSVIA